MKNENSIVCLEGIEANCDALAKHCAIHAPTSLYFVSVLAKNVALLAQIVKTEIQGNK